MRFLAWRRRSVQWCGVYVLAVLATGAYLAFEVLDLDASQVRAVPATAAVTAEVSRVDPDPEHRSTSMSGPAGLLFLSQTHDRRMALLRAASAAGTATLAVRRNSALPRGRVARDTGCISAPTSSDPA